MKFSDIQTNEDFAASFQSEIWREVAEQICRRHRIIFDALQRAASSDHVVFLIDDRLILKIYRPFRSCFERETKAIEFVGSKTNFKIPEILETKEIENFRYALMTQLPSVTVARADWLQLAQKKQSEFISKLAVGLKQLHALDASSFVSDWETFVEDRAASFIERQIRHGVNEKIIQALPVFIEENLKLILKNPPPVFMHGDVHFGNLRIMQNHKGEWEISGLFDFADSRIGFHEYEFLAVGLLIMQGQGEVQREFFKAYGYSENELDEAMRKRLMMLTMLYETADLRRYAMRLDPAAVNYSLDELERGIWAFAD